MGSRARKTPSGEDGFIIIEVLVSALILAIVAGAVLTLITATTRGAAVQRDRAVANDVAQADQAALRDKPLTEINGVKREESELERNGTKYKVVSERVYVNNKSGTVSCTGAGATPDYVQLTSTVSWPTAIHPVVLQSVVSPSTGSLNSSYGNIDIAAANAAGEPLPGVSVSITPNAKTATTGSQGCANFVSLPEGTYTVLYKGAGLVFENGESKWEESFLLKGGETHPATARRFDHPATFEPEFVYLEPGTGTLRPAPVDSMYVVNPTSPYGGAPFGTPGGATRSVTQVDAKAFPFKGSEYTVYGGSCATNNPGTSPSNKVGLFSAEAKPEGILRPQIHVPALELTVTTKSGKEGKEGTELLVSGAKVTLTDTKCKSGSSLVKRTYYTNSAGHLSNEKAVKENAAKAPTEAGMPFGAYEICASATIGTELRTAKVTEQKVEDFTSKGTVLKMNLVKGSTPC